MGERLSVFKLYLNQKSIVIIDGEKSRLPKNGYNRIQARYDNLMS